MTRHDVVEWLIVFSLVLLFLSAFVALCFVAALFS